MRLATFDAGRGPRVGIVASDDTLIALADLVPDAPDDMLGVVAAGDALHERIRDVASRAKNGGKISQVRLLAPIPRPRRNVFCVGWNYAEHLAEGARALQPSGAPAEIPEYPALFTKNPATVTGPDAPIWYPDPHSTQLDWECELAVIISRPGLDIDEAAAMTHVFGYTCANDVSVRDVQRRHGVMVQGRTLTSLPLGPWIGRRRARSRGAAHTYARERRDETGLKHRFMVFKLPRLVASSPPVQTRTGDV